MDIRKALNLTSRGIGAYRAVRKGKTGPWAKRQVGYIAAGKITAWLMRGIR